MQSCIDWFCAIFYQSVLPGVSLIYLHEQIQTHIGCIGTIFRQSES